MSFIDNLLHFINGHKYLLSYIISLLWVKIFLPMKPSTFIMSTIFLKYFQMSQDILLFCLLFFKKRNVVKLIFVCNENCQSLPNHSSDEGEESPCPMNVLDKLGHGWVCVRQKFCQWFYFQRFIALFCWQTWFHCNERKLIQSFIIIHKYTHTQFQTLKNWCIKI